MIVEKTHTKKSKIVLTDEVNCFITGLHPDQIEYFYKEYGVRAENYFFAPSYKLKKWDGNIRFFQKTGKTYQYLLPEIVPKVIAFGYEIELDDRRVHKGLEIDPIDCDYFSEFIDPKTNEPYQLRWYQVDAINHALTEGKGIIIAGTGAGKTSVNACIVDVYAKQGLKTITIVPNLSLIDRTVSEFKFFNLDVSEISASIKDYKHTHVVTTWQSLKNIPHVLKEFQVVVVDECHKVKSSVLTELLNNHGAHIPYRIGLTGTLPKAPADKLAVKVALGDVTETQGRVDDGRQPHQRRRASERRRCAAGRQWWSIQHPGDHRAKEQQGHTASVAGSPSSPSCSVTALMMAAIVDTAFWRHSNLFECLPKLPDKINRPCVTRQTHWPVSFLPSSVL